MNDNIIFKTVANGHEIVVYRYPTGHPAYSKTVYVSNNVRDERGGLFDLAALHDYDGYTVERGFNSAADALHYARKCLMNAKMPF